MNNSSYRIIRAEFETSVFDTREFQNTQLPEIAFAGRSNVGKSTLINALCGRSALAKTSKTPGRTASLNYFRVTFGESAQEREEERYDAYFVDLPGYGYAKVAKSERKRWATLVEHYLFNSEMLKSVLLLIDSRRGVQAEEKWFLNLKEQLDLLVVLTKADKLSKRELSIAQSGVAKELGLQPEAVSATALLGKKFGLEGILRMLDRGSRLK